MGFESWVTNGGRAESRPLLPRSHQAQVGWLAVGRQHSVGVPQGELSFWLQVRGTGCVCAREGRFRLAAGDWIVLDKCSVTEARGGAHTLMLGVVLAGVSALGMRDIPLLPGRGRMSRRMMLETMRLWRRGRQATHETKSNVGDEPELALKALLTQIGRLERDYDSTIARCPGRSITSKRKVFARMQRARLLLDGNRHRIVRLTELSELTSFSSWYLSKKYLEIYQESPQASSLRLRLQHALDLLAETDWSIKRVAAECGFENSGSFGRTFRRLYGQTPSESRQSKRSCEVQRH